MSFTAHKKFQPFHTRLYTQTTVSPHVMQKLNHLIQSAKILHENTAVDMLSDEKKLYVQMERERNREKEREREREREREKN